MSRIVFVGVAALLIGSPPAWSQLAAQRGVAVQHQASRSPAPIVAPPVAPATAPAPRTAGRPAPAPHIVSVGSDDRPATYAINPTPTVYAISSQFNTYKIQ